MTIRQQSKEEEQSPILSHRGLTIMLFLMCVIPVGTIFLLWNYMPQVHEGQLEANVIALGLPETEFYQGDYKKRPEVESGSIIVQNKSNVDWTHLNIQVNGHYSIYDIEKIPAGGEKEYLLSKFLNRTGARFSLRYNELARVRIYARRPTKDRATYAQTFDTYGDYSPKFFPVIILLLTFLVLLTLASLMFRRMWLASEKESAQMASQV
ncbi:MAG: hypothetical protein AAF623_02805 [Planctomycetota bacterium]